MNPTWMLIFYIGCMNADCLTLDRFRSHAECVVAAQTVIDSLAEDEPFAISCSRAKDFPHLSATEAASSAPR